MKTDLELQLEASLLYVQMRKRVETLTAQLALMLDENEHLRAENRVLELKLQRLVRPRVVA
jgi:regulator of replication initiation timing